MEGCPKGPRPSGRGWIVALAVVLAVPAVAPAQNSILQALTQRKDPERLTLHMVPMRDGVKLATDVILPEGEGPWPVVLTRTPYGRKTTVGNREIDFVKHGYVRINQDCRGRFDSEGEFGTFELEGVDGFDTIAWIAQQPWCDGNVGMFGVSATGITANFAAMKSPPNLRCSFVCVAHGCDFRYGSFNGGVFLLDLNERWFRALGHPLENIANPTIAVYDAGFASRDLQRNYDKVQIPVFNVGGWYDLFSEATVENFSGLDEHGADLARGNQRLLMGAFGHFPINGSLKYPKDASNLDTSMVIPWFDRWLKGDQTALSVEPRVRYYLMGDCFDAEAPGNQWRTADRFPPPAKEHSLYLRDGGELTSEPPASAGVDRFAYDPRMPVKTVGGNNLFLARGPMDQRAVGDRKDVLKYVSEPLPAALEVVGRVHAELFVSTDAADTDFMVKLIDIYPDGYEALVCDQPLRLRYRDGWENPQPAKPGEVYKLRINLWTTALVFNRGHRIAVTVTSSNAPRFQPHTNTWEPVASLDQAVIANNGVYREPERASRVILPVTKIYDQTKAAAIVP